MFDKDFVKSCVKTPEKFLIEVCDPEDELVLKSKSGDAKNDLFLYNKTKGIFYVLALNVDAKTVTENAISYLNEVTGKSYRPGKQAEKLVSAILRKDYDISHIKKVIDNKAKSWIGGQMEPYMRPSTLFGPKFDEYLNEGDMMLDKGVSDLRKIKESMEGKNAQEKLKF